MTTPHLAPAHAGLTTIEFFGGLGVIGGTKFLVTSPAGVRFLADLGSDIEPDDADAKHSTARPARLPSCDAAAISHAHIDHDGRLGEVDAATPVYATRQTVDMLRAYRDVGEMSFSCPLIAADRVTIGDLSVTLVPVDHDVPGACGMIITTPTATIAYTGDINFHGPGAPGASKTSRFIERATGADALVAETTLFSFDGWRDAREAPNVNELAHAFSQLCASEPTVVYFSTYERDVVRHIHFERAAAAVGRTIVYSPRRARLSHLLGRDVCYVADAGATCPGTAVSMAEIAAHPTGFAVCVDTRDMLCALTSYLHEQDVYPRSWYHSNGDPLGPFMPDYAEFHAARARLGIGVIDANASGHGCARRMNEMVDTIGARQVFAVHGFHPERLGGNAICPSYGQVYVVGSAGTEPRTRSDMEGTTPSDQS